MIFFISYSHESIWLCHPRVLLAGIQELEWFWIPARGMRQRRRGGVAQGMPVP
jgi:hypothetical protein